jgi:hypothetical protein
MFYASRNGVLNNGTNRETSIKSTNNWFYNTSSNQEPYYKNTTKGAIIPLALKN